MPIHSRHADPSRKTWLRSLGPDDEVWWTDPNRGEASGAYRILKIENGVITSGSDLVSLKKPSGELYEHAPVALASELSAGRPVCRIRLTLDIDYDLNGEPASDMMTRLQNMVARAYGNGDLTQDTPAEVISHEVVAVERPEPLSEDRLSAFMLERIEEGQLSPEEIPLRLARYGLMEPADFISEMRERMENRDEEGETQVCSSHGRGFRP